MKFFPRGNERRVRLGASFAFFVCFSWSAHGAAQSDALALAEALFQEGRALLEKGELAQACPKLAESYKLDPATGTLLNLAYCHEREGKLATAWAEFRTALSRVKRDGREERVKFARDSIARLEPKLPRVVLEVEAPPGEALRIELDGTELGRAAWGMPMPVDPGAHVIRALSPGRKPHQSQWEVAEAQTLTVRVPALERDGAVDPHSVEEPATVQDASPDANVGPAPASSARRTALYASGALGVLGIAAGSFFGVVAIRQKQESDEDCDSQACGSEAHEKYEMAQRNAMISNVGFGVGVLGLGVATYLYLTEGEPESSGNVSGTSPARQRGRDASPQSLAGWTAFPLVAPVGAGIMVRSTF